jgi:hypothetical protein
LPDLPPGARAEKARLHRVVFVFQQPISKGTAEMADQSQPGEMPKTDPEVKEPLTDVSKPEPQAKKAEMAATPEELQNIKDELEKTRKALGERNKENAERRKRLEELEAAEAERQKAAMTEAEKLQARIKELETANAESATRLKAQEHRELQTKVAKAVAKELGLPFEAVEALADRLRGETEEDLAADAKIVFAVLPKPQQENTPEEKNKLKAKIEPTNPNQGQKGETREQARGRLLGTSVNTWDSNLAKEHGGGYSIVEKGE